MNRRDFLEMLIVVMLSYTLGLATGAAICMSAR